MDHEVIVGAIEELRQLLATDSKTSLEERKAASITSRVLEAFLTYHSMRGDSGISHKVARKLLLGILSMDLSTIDSGRREMQVYNRLCPMTEEGLLWRKKRVMRGLPI